MSTANELKQQINKIQNKAAKDITKLKSQLSLVTSPFSVGDVLQSTLNPAHSFMVISSNEDGLVGVLSDARQVIRAEDSKHWKLRKDN